MRRSIYLAIAIPYFVLSSMTAPLSLNAQEALCIDGQAASFPCSKIDLMSYRNTDWLNRGGGNGNDIWGWTDPLDQREYALMGTAVSTVIIDITDADDPQKVFRIPAQSRASSWRDIKVYKDHAFIVSEAASHGMQIVDLSKVRDADRSVVPNVFPDAIYTGFGSAHNVVINEESGFAYGVGTRRTDDDICPAGLHAVDIRDPLNPSFAGCFNSDGYTHDAQCVIYRGPDSRFTGRELCFASNEDTLTIIDFTDKANPSMISRTSYVGDEYTHQGWLSKDHRYFFSNDELDEIRTATNTRTIIWDLSQLDDPVASFFSHPTLTSDHNLYTTDRFVFMANYRSGLRVYELDTSNPDELSFSNLSFIDTVPNSDDRGTSGAWSTYPYFCSGNVLVSNIQEGFFVVRPHDQSFISSDCGATTQIGDWSAEIVGEIIELDWSTLKEQDNLGFDIQFAASNAEFESVAFVQGSANSQSEIRYSFQIPINGVGQYQVRIVDKDSQGNYRYWPSKMISVEIPGDRLIYESFPNPFNTTTKARFAVKDSQWVTATLHNSKGQKVATPYSRFSEGGITHSFQIDGLALSSGQYYLQFEGENFIDYKVLTILH